MQAVYVLKYVVAIALVLHGSAAMAANTKTYPGNSCVATGTYAKEAVAYVDRLWNTGTHTLFVKYRITTTSLAPLMGRGARLTTYQARVNSSSTWPLGSWK